MGIAVCNNFSTPENFKNIVRLCWKCTDAPYTPSTNIQPEQLVEQERDGVMSNQDYKRPLNNIQFHTETVQSNSIL